jgi:hypothetical protein
LAKVPEENPNPVLRIKKDGLILFANRGSQPILDAWGRKNGQHVPDDIKQQLNDMCDSKQSQELEFTHLDRSFAITIMPSTNTDFINIYGWDITKYKRN